MSEQANTLNPLQRLQTSQRADTARYFQSKIDSIQHGITSRLDSITGKYSSALSKMQHFSNSVKAKMDSVAQKNLPTDKYRAQLDSVSGKFRSMQNELSSKIESVKFKATKKIDAIPFPPELKQHITALESGISKFGPETIFQKLPDDLKITQVDMSGLNGMSSLVIPTSLNGIPNLSIPGTPKIPGSDLNLPIDQINSNSVEAKISALPIQTKALAK